jgi:hypothetical protein
VGGKKKEKRKDYRRGNEDLVEGERWVGGSWGFITEVTEAEHRGHGERRERLTTKDAEATEDLGEGRDVGRRIVGDLSQRSLRRSTEDTEKEG